MEEELKDICFRLRAVILDNSKEVKGIMAHGEFKNEQSSAGQHGEMRANIMLTYRHLEDARMRLGKVVQAFDGGTSCYEK